MSNQVITPQAELFDLSAVDPFSQSPSSSFAARSQSSAGHSLPLGDNQYFTHILESCLNHQDPQQEFEQFTASIASIDLPALVSGSIDSQPTIQTAAIDVLTGLPADQLLPEISIKSSIDAEEENDHPDIGLSIIEQFTPAFGYGLVNAAAVIAQVSGRLIEDVPNLGEDSWHLDLVNAPEVWSQGITGKGVVVAVIDNGIDINHPDLAQNIWHNPNEIADDGIDNDANGYIDDVHGWNFAQGQHNNNVTPLGDASHGTHIAGIIAADDNGFGVTGVAPDAQIMAIKIGDTPNSNRFVNAGDLSAAVRYAVDNGADVINLSLSWPTSDSLAAALLYAASQNVIVVHAAGNDSNSDPNFPAAYATEYGISVGAIDQNQGLANFSNQAGGDADLHHVVAPGVSINSTGANFSRYLELSGTSIAAPHVAGVVALMLQINPSLTQAQVVNTLIRQTTVIG